MNLRLRGKSNKPHLEINKMRMHGRDFSKCRIKGQISLQVLRVSARFPRLRSYDG